MSNSIKNSDEIKACDYEKIEFTSKNCMPEKVTESGHSKRKDRNQKRNKQKKQKRKIVEKDSNLYETYEDFMNYNIPRSNDTKKSPLLLISKSYEKIKESSIILQNLREVKKGNCREIHYDVGNIGSKISYAEIGKYMKLLPETTKKNVMYILLPFKEVMNNPNLIFYTKNEKLINELNIYTDKGYILIATIQFEGQLHKDSPIISSNEDLKIAKKFFYNQITKKKMDIILIQRVLSMDLVMDQSIE